MPAVRNRTTEKYPVAPIAARLLAELGVLKSRLEGDSSTQRLQMRRVFGIWRFERSFASIRDPKEQSRLPSDKRRMFRQFWCDVDAAFHDAGPAPLK